MGTISQAEVSADAFGWLVGFSSPRLTKHKQTQFLVPKRAKKDGNRIFPAVPFSFEKVTWGCSGISDGLRSGVRPLL